MLGLSCSFQRAQHCFVPRPRHFFAISAHTILQLAARCCRIADKCPGRIAGQCKQRWKNAIKPGVKGGRWKKEEDTLLTEVVMAALLLGAVGGPGPRCIG
jgi:hypothetical protein